MLPAHSQDRHRIRVEWGLTGARELTAYAAGQGDVVAVVVDVLSFTTCVSVALDAGMAVHPYRWSDSSAADFAAERGAVLARPRPQAEPHDVSLSPASLRTATGIGEVVLPSPNGSTISAVLDGAGATVLAASLRNAGAVGDWLAAAVTGGRPVVVVPAGERWPDQSLRPAVEDLWGAGAVIDALATAVGAGAGSCSPLCSPEAEVARLAFRQVAPGLEAALAACASGRELTERGYAQDLSIAAELASSEAVPVLRDGVFVRAG